MGSQLLTNQWFGKAVGFTAAFVLAPRDQVALSIAVILGIACGHLFDLWAARASTDNPPNASARKKGRSSDLSNPHLQFLFTALGRIAKQSGVVSKKHIALTEKFIVQLDLNRQERDRAVNWFNQGKSPASPIESLAQRCRSADAKAKDWGSVITRYMAQMAALNPTDEALATTVKFAGLLNIAPGDVAAAFGAALEGAKTSRQSTSESQPTKSREPTPLELAYRCLGITDKASMTDVKTAYRRLISKHHPDKLGPKAADSVIQEAEHRMVELREALELIEASGQ